MTTDNDDLINRLMATGRLDPRHAFAPVPLPDLPTDIRPFAAIVDELQNVGQYAGAPALEDDPAAKLLGLVPTPTKRLDGRLLRRQRQRFQRTVSEIAAELSRRGWSFTAADVMRWETTDAADVPPVVIDSLASLLGAAAEQLISVSAPAEQDDLVQQLRRHPRFSALVERWAQLRHITVPEARTALERRALSTVHRGARTDVDDTLSSIEALVRALENRNSR
jgi:hypothetical protein